MENFFGYFNSPFYRWRIFLLLSFFTGFLVALFPFNDFSLEHMFAPETIILFCMATGLAAAVIFMVSFVWYFIDLKKETFEDRYTRRVAQLLLGGVLPVIGIAAEIIIVFGWDLFFRHEMQYHFWFYVALVTILNMYCKVLSLEAVKSDLLQELGLLRDESQKYEDFLRAAESQVDWKTIEHDQARQELGRLMKENQELRQKIAFLNSPYVIKVGNNSKKFPKDEVAGFLIRKSERRKGSKPIIDMYLHDGESYLDHRETLKEIQREFPEMRLITRQLLVHPKSLLGYKVASDDTVLLDLDFLSESYVLKTYQWDKHKEWIKNVVDNLNVYNNEHQGPSPDALGA